MLWQCNVDILTAKFELSTQVGNNIIVMEAPGLFVALCPLPMEENATEQKPTFVTSRLLKSFPQLLLLNATFPKLFIKERFLGSPFLDWARFFKNLPKLLVDISHLSFNVS